MKVFLYTNFAKRFAEQTKSVFLFILSILVFSSCKKELLTDEKENLVLAQNGIASIKPIDYSDFLKKINLNKIGKVGEMFRENPSGASVRIENSNSTGLALEIETNNIKELRAKGHVSYVFSIKLPSRYAQTFSNLTIDIKDDTVKAFINTYKPTLEWIKDWKLKRAGVFTGDVSYVALNDFMASGSNNTKGIMGGLTCTYWEEYDIIAYQCQGVPYCWPDNKNCYWYGTPNGAGYRTEVRSRMECVLPGSGGGGGEGTGGNPGGGGGYTTPNTPYSYEPCDQPPSRPNPNVPPCEEPTMAENLISVLGITNQDQIDFLNNPTRNLLVNQMNSYLWLNEGSIEIQEFLKWAVGYLVDFPDAGINELITNNNIPNSNINLPILDTSELTNYPAFKALVEDLPNFLNNYPNILKALEYTTGFKQQKIMQLMQPGKGPKVVVVHNLRDSEGNKVDGHYNRTNRSLQIDDAHAIGISAINNQVQYQALGLMLTIATLHEFVHFGRHANDLPIRIKDVSGDRLEAGWYFEGNIQPPGAPGYIQPSNAKEWLKFYKVKPKN